MILHYSYRCRGRFLITKACAHSHYQRDWRRAHPCDVEQACSRPHAACDGRRSIRPTRPHTTPTTRTGCSPVRGRAPRPRLTRGAPKRREKSRSRSPRRRPPRSCRERPRAQPARLHRARHCRTSSCLRRPSRASRAGSTRGDLQRQTRLDADDGGMTMPMEARAARPDESRRAASRRHPDARYRFSQLAVRQVYLWRRSPSTPPHRAWPVPRDHLQRWTCRAASCENR